MSPFLEALLFIAIVAGGCWTASLLTKRGRRRWQTKNAATLAEAVQFTCPAHGAYSALTAVLFEPDGNSCPTCYRERLLAERRRTTNPS